MCVGDGTITQAKTNHIVSNDGGARGLSALNLELQKSNEEGSLMCHGDGATKSKNMGMHEGCLEQGKKYLEQSKKVHIEYPLNNA